MQGFTAVTYKNKVEMMAVLKSKRDKGIITPYEEEVLDALEHKSYKKSNIDFDKRQREEFRKRHERNPTYIEPPSSSKGNKRKK